VQGSKDYLAKSASFHFAGLLGGCSGLSRAALAGVAAGAAAIATKLGEFWIFDFRID